MDKNEEGNLICTSSCDDGNLSGNPSLSDPSDWKEGCYDNQTILNDYENYLCCENSESTCNGCSNGKELFTNGTTLDAYIRNV